MQRNLITVSIFSHNELVREGLKRLLLEGDFSANCHASAELGEVIDSLSDDPSHVVLLESDRASTAIGMASEVREKLANVRLAVLTGKAEPADVRSAMAAGVDAYLSMVTHHVPLLLMLELVSHGEKVFPKEFFEESKNIESNGDTKSWLNLKLRQGISRREYSILQCLVDGDPNKVIARKLGITEATVKIHVKGILRKLNVINRTQAAIWMINNSPSGGKELSPELDGHPYHDDENSHA